MAKTPYLIQQGRTWWFSRAVPRQLQEKIGKKLWRERLGHDLGEARREVIRCLAKTDQEIELAQLPTEEERRARRQELLHQQLQGLDPEEIFDHPRFYGSPEFSKFLSVLPRTSGKTAAEILDLAVDLKNPAAGTVKEYRASLEKFQTHYGSEYLLGADKEAATAFRNDLLSRYKISTAKKTIRYLSGLWEVCVDEQWTDANPWKGILKHVRDDTHRGPIEVPEGSWEVVPTLPPRHQALFWLIAYSGVRIQEALGLRGKDLDLKAGVIQIASHEKRGIGNGIKNENSIRSIPIDPRLRPWMELVATSNELVFPEFLSGSGNWNTPSFWQKRLRCSPHKLRHEVATQLRGKNVNEQTIADLLGHSVKTVTGGYGQTTTEAMSRALALLKWPIKHDEQSGRRK